MTRPPDDSGVGQSAAGRSDIGLVQQAVAKFGSAWLADNILPLRALDELTPEQLAELAVTACDALARADATDRGNQATQSGTSPPLLSPILDRVRRSDYWQVAARGAKPCHEVTSLTDAVVASHLAGRRKIGACPIERGGNTVRIAALDLDDHKGDAIEAEMREVAAGIIATAEMLFGIELIPFRSTGGRGMHLYAIWDEPQDARSVREHLGSLLKACRLRSGTRGGVKAGVVEVFPKQDSVPADGWGSMFILPMSGESVPLDRDTLMPTDLFDVEWPTSDPVPALAPVERMAVALAVPPSLERLQSALQCIDPNTLDYGGEAGATGWLEILYGVHWATGGSEEGRAIIHNWSQQFSRYSAEETDKQWNYARTTKSDGRVITSERLFNAARVAGWRDPEYTAGLSDLRIEAVREVDSKVRAGESVPVAQLAEVATYDDDVVVAANVHEQTREAIEKARESAKAEHLPVRVLPEIPAELSYSKKGDILPLLGNVMFGCASPGIAGVMLGFDTFLDDLVLSADGGKRWISFADEHYAAIQVRLNRRRFPHIAKDALRDAVYAVARSNEFDSAQQWLERLPAWDEVPRVEPFCARYLATEDTPYTRAVGGFLWTALAGRVMDPGCKVDMAPVLVGGQGAGKSTAIAAMSPSPDYFAEITFGLRDADMSRKMRGLLVGELAELRGLATRDIEGIKAWMAQRYERWTPKFKEREVRIPRRCVFVGSTNKAQFLADTTGERRWLPITVGRCDPVLIARDRDQLWAEGLAKWRTSGIAWRDAERLAEPEHGRFKAPDLWEDRIEQFLAKDGSEPFTLTDVLSRGIGLDVAKARRADESRAADILRMLGYESKQFRHKGEKGRFWIRGKA